MDWDEPKFKPLRGIATGEPLDTLGIAELEARVAALEAEIERHKTEIASKQRQAAAAAEIFRA